MFVILYELNGSVRSNQLNKLIRYSIFKSMPSDRVLSTWNSIGHSKPLRLAVISSLKYWSAYDQGHIVFWSEKAITMYLIIINSFNPNSESKEFSLKHITEVFLVRHALDLMLLTNTGYENSTCQIY